MASGFLNQVLPGPSAVNGGAGLLPLVQNPYMLSALIFLFEHTEGGALPRNAGALFRSLARALWERERKRQTTGWVPFEDAERAYAKLAFAMIEGNRPTSVSTQYVLKELGSEHLLALAQGATYLVREGETVRFYHQLLQEYFAAVALQALGLKRVLKQPSYQYMPGGVRSDPMAWPARHATKWDAVVVALCGIVDHPDEVIVSVLQVEPALAAACMASGLLLDPGTRSQVFDAMIGRLQQTRYGPESRAMVEAFRRLGDPEASLRLAEAVRDELSRDPIHSDILENAIVALGGCQTAPAIKALTEVIERDSTKLSLRAIRSLGDIGDETAVQLLLGLLDNDTSVHLYFSTSSSLRSEAIGALGRIGERTPGAVIPAMLAGLRSPNPRRRSASAAVLAHASDATAVQPLVDALVYDIDEGVRWSSESALGKVRDRAAVPALLDGLRHSNARVRCASAKGLGSIGNPAATGALLDAIVYDVDSHVRGASATALGMIGDGFVAARLLEVAERDADSAVVAAAHAAAALILRKQ